MVRVAHARATQARRRGRVIGQEGAVEADLNTAAEGIGLRRRTGGGPLLRVRAIDGDGRRETVA